jgi:hypothetical protein
MRIIIVLVFTFHFLAGNSQKMTNVKIIKVDNSFDSVTNEKLSYAANELQRILNTEEFKRGVKNEKFNVGNFGLTSEEIFEVIISGKDDYKGTQNDYSIDLRVKVFNEYFGHGNFGVTDMISRVTRTHRCYILKNDVKCYISHLAHEYMHQIGFYDERTWWLGKKTESVPYKIGAIIDDLIGNTAICSAIDETCSKQ